MGLGIAAMAYPWAGPARSLSPSNPPNLIIIYADDVGYGDLSCYGNPTIKTPELDQMAEEGIRLTSFYAAPTCSPSRIALLTGRYPARTGLGRDWGGGVGSDTGIPAYEVTLAEVLKQQGYRTQAIGKWHLGYAKDEYLPTGNGFDSWFGLPYSNDMQQPWVQTEVPLQLYRDTTPIEYPVNQCTLTTRYTQEAIQFIKSSAGHRFFLYLAHSMAHLPIHTTEEFLGKSRGGLYGDVIETLDWSTGQILSTLKELGIDNQTLVAFASDNGPWLNLPDRMLQDGIRPWHAGSPGPLGKWKATTYEGGVRVPAIVRWPGQIPSGQVSADIVSNMDIFTTFIKAAGGKVPADRPIDGLDLMPFLQGKSPSPRKDFYYFRRGYRLEAYREGRWKFRFVDHTEDAVSAGDGPTPELFELERDPSERFNVAVEHPDIVARLKGKMLQFGEEVNAEFIFPNE